MATLREIRRKLHSVKNIEKITQAMEMVAASRLKKAQAKAEMSRPYALKLRDILEKLVFISDDFTHPLVCKRDVKKVGVIIIASDKGLCGSYNNAVFLSAERFLRNFPSEQIELFVFGRKAVDHFSRKSWQISRGISDWGGKISYSQVEQLTLDLIALYTAEQLDEIWMVYTRYISISSREMVVEKLLNIENMQLSVTDTKTNYILEPEPAEILAEILPCYCITKVQSALHEAYAAELAARIFSMRAATKNAEEIIEKLTLFRNKVRQSGITRELIEITSCAESLK